MSELHDLIEAATAAPRSAGILRALARTASEAVDPSPAIEFFARADNAGVDQATQMSIAAFLLQHAEPRAALLWCKAESPEDMVVRARIYLALDDRELALKTYLKPSLRLLDERGSDRLGPVQMCSEAIAEDKVAAKHPA